MAGDGKNLLWIEHSTLPAQHSRHKLLVHNHHGAKSAERRLFNLFRDLSVGLVPEQLLMLSEAEVVGTELWSHSITVCRRAF
jgi:hypothetical protein